MRILLVSHAALTAELGAAQLALNLAGALRDRGHDAVAWSPEPLPSGPWWSLWLRQRREIERFAAAQGPFEVIDTPAISASAALARHTRCLVARSVQPELLYLFTEAGGDLRRLTPRGLAHLIHHVPRAAAIVEGWRRARLILCLGSLELAWMRRRFPFWAAKMALYVVAPAAGERTVLTEVWRLRDTCSDQGGGTRFLWIGRWVAHKGTRRLLRFLAQRLETAPADTFTIAGCGPDAEREVPEEWVRSGRVRLVPSFPRSELPALLAVHDAGLFTSKVEGWGLSLNEMLESGLPVYAMEAGAVRDLRPFFPGFLNPFPPPHCCEPPGSPPDLETNGYYGQMSWDAIAERYEKAVLPLVEAGPR